MPPDTRIEVDIEDVQLDGLGPYRADVLAAAVEQELARLIAEEGLPPALGRAPGVRRPGGGAPGLRQGTPEREAVAGIARAIHEGFGRGGER
jgi:hypothetical protein